MPCRSLVNCVSDAVILFHLTSRWLLHPLPLIFPLSPPPITSSLHHPLQNLPFSRTSPHLIHSRSPYTSFQYSSLSLLSQNVLQSPSSSAVLSSTSSTSFFNASSAGEVAEYLSLFPSHFSHYPLLRLSFTTTPGTSTAPPPPTHLTQRHLFGQSLASLCSLWNVWKVRRSLSVVPWDGRSTEL